MSVSSVAQLVAGCKGVGPAELSAGGPGSAGLPRGSSNPNKYSESVSRSESGSGGVSPGLVKVRFALRGLLRPRARRSSVVVGCEVMDVRTGKMLRIDALQSRLARERRRVFAWAEAMNGYLQSRGGLGDYRLVMQTLTYAPGDEWQPGDISAYMYAVKSRLVERLLGYCWAAEVQRRGAVHYHVLLVVPKGTDVPLPDKSGLWRHGLTRTETARTVFYICRYVGKEYQKLGLPSGARCFAVYVRRAAVSELTYWRFRLSAVPGWLREQIGARSDLVSEKWRRCPGGGWLWAGQRLESPWVFRGLLYAT